LINNLIENQINLCKIFKSYNPKIIEKIMKSRKNQEEMFESIMLYYMKLFKALQWETKEMFNILEKKESKVNAITPIGFIDEKLHEGKGMAEIFYLFKGTPFHWQDESRIEQAIIYYNRIHSNECRAEEIL